MKKTTKRLLSALCVAALLLGLMPLSMLAMAADEPAHTLWIVGDSTVCEFNDAYYYPRYGYGTQIENYLDGSYAIKNLALSGRSSKSFVTEPQYKALKDGIKEGDALIIGFGHNDEKDDDATRFTSPIGDWQTEGSFAKSLYDNYVKLAQDAKAEAILCTPIVRRTSSGTFSQSQLHVDNGGSYPDAIIQLGKDKNCTVVDLTDLTHALYDELGPDETLYLHTWTGMKEGSVDNTHLNIYGAKRVAYLLAKSLQEQKATCELGKHVTDLSGVTFNRETDLVSNPDYVEPDYTPNLPQSANWEDFVATNKATGKSLIFKGTVFGDVGGASKIVPGTFTLEPKDGKAHIAVMGGNGKIAGSSDGVAMYYLKVPSGIPFTFSAKATVNGFRNDAASMENQAGFGIMARDDMYIDVSDGSIKSDYVAAAAYCDSAAATGKYAYASYYRKDGTIGGKGDQVTLAKGGSYDMQIVYNGDGYTCKFGDGPVMAGGYDFQLTSVDPDYVFLGLYVSRAVDVTFSDISLDIEGGGYVSPMTWPETLSAHLVGLEADKVTAVKYNDGEKDYTLSKYDITYLVREDATGARVDIPGVAEGTYSLTVTAGGKDYTANNISVAAYDRSGFAHYNYTEGVGAYKDDGTLKDDAIVVYVTDENKNEVTVSFTRNGDPKTIVGIGNILNSNNSKVNQGLLEFLSKENKKPLVIRFIGDVTAPEGVSEFKMGSSNGSMVYMLSGSNVTLEGVGPDATIDGWGFSFAADKDDTQYNKQAKNFEVRNLTFKNVPEDCIEVTGFGNSDGTIKESVEHIWIHNNEFYVPHIANPAEDDKAEGDGAVDFKWGRYMTMSYNYFDSYHKTSLLGGADHNQQYHVTWHHNYWKNVQSRAPLARQADVHIYNNLFDHQTSYCMSLRANTYIYSESNAFVNCKNPIRDEKSGGVAKSFNDFFDADTTGDNHAIRVADKSVLVESANPYANFDADANSYVGKGEYKLDSVKDALSNITALCGTMGNTIKATVPAHIHSYNYEADTDPVKATCTTPGTATFTCTETSCPDTASKGALSLVTAAALGHDLVDVAAKEATCGEDGYAAHKGCSRCDFAEEHETYPATGEHDYAEGVCTVCGAEDPNYDPDKKPEKDSLTLKPESVTVKATKTATVTATVTGYKSKVLSAASDNDNLATATVSGKTITVKGVAEGTTNVYVVMSDTKLTTAADIKAVKGYLTVPVTVTEYTSGTNVGTGSSTGSTPSSTTTKTDTTDEGGKVTTTTSSDGDKTITVTDETGEVIAKVVLPATVPALGYTFEDVPADHWAADAINQMAALGVVKGVSAENHVFDMTSDITRGAMAQILFNLSNGKTGIAESFADVAEGAWYTDAIAWAAQAGVVTGYDANTFGPDDAITREQLAVMLYRYADLLGIGIITNRSNVLGGFADVDTVSDWATEAMTWAVANGIIQGTGEGLNPGASASRAETAMMMSRFLELAK